MIAGGRVHSSNPASACGSGVASPREGQSQLPVQPGPFMPVAVASSSRHGKAGVSHRPLSPLDPSLPPSKPLSPLLRRNLDLWGPLRTLGSFPHAVPHLPWTCLLLGLGHSHPARPRPAQAARQSQPRGSSRSPPTIHTVLPPVQSPPCSEIIFIHTSLPF